MTEPREMGFRDARRGDPARFLRELRELRDHAGLGQAELAARAHYPCDAIKAAEAGPALPDLPVLSAYVRGCGGTFAEWEERWRSLTGSPASPLLPARAAGCSEAASAGARVSISSAVADGHDPALVMAALHRVADGMAAASPTLPAPRGSADSGNAADSAVRGAVISDAVISDAAVAGSLMPDPAVADDLITDEALWDAAAAAWAAGERAPDAAAAQAAAAQQADKPTPTAVRASEPSAAEPAGGSTVAGNDLTNSGVSQVFPVSRSSRHTWPSRPVRVALIAAALLLIVVGVLALLA